MQYFGAHLFDVVFTDVCMDGTSGLELLDRFSNMDETIKTIIMTAHAGYDTVLQALQGGAFDYIEKPILNHARLAAVARKAHSYALLQRDNIELIAKLKASQGKLALANEQIVELNNKIVGLAATDPLTGLKNRQHIDDALMREIALHRRYESPFSALLISVDHFQSVNDTYGRAKGDEMLKYLAEIFVSNSRESDTVGRFGGEEFFMLLHGADVNGAQIVANRILTQVQEPIGINNEPVSVTVSIGIAELDDKDKIAHSLELVRRCDQALYVAKKNGRNRVEVYQSEFDNLSSQDLQATG